MNKSVAIFALMMAQQMSGDYTHGTPKLNPKVGVKKKRAKNKASRKSRKRNRK